MFSEYLVSTSFGGYYELIGFILLLYEKFEFFGLPCFERLTILKGYFYATYF